MKSRILLILIFPVLALGGCKKDELMPASITGIIHLEGSDTHEGVIVTAKSGDVSASGTSSSDGTFRITGLVTGTYNLTFTKEGYLGANMKGVMVVGGNEDYDLGSNNLYKESGDSMPSIYVEVQSYPDGNPATEAKSWSVIIRDKSKDGNIFYDAALFISRDKEVAYNKYEGVFFNVSNLYLLEPAYNSEDHFYARAYRFRGTLTTYNSFNYPDPVTGAIIYYGILPDTESELLEFTLN